MAEIKQGTNGLDGDATKAGVDTHDISKTLFGAQAISAKTMLSANRMATDVDDAEASRLASKREREQDAEEARQLAHLAEWKRQMTMIGGIEMTNAEAQESRRRVLENGEHHARWLEQQGKLAPEEKDAFLKGMQRKIDLEDKRGRGTITADDEAEEAALDRSKVGKAIEAATAQDHVRNGVLPSLAMQSAAAGANLRSTSASSTIDNSALFQSAPEVSTSFNAAVTPASPPPVVPPARLPIAAEIKATGLDI